MNNKELFPITSQQPKSPVAEAYRTLRTNLGFSAIDNPCRSLLVTSANPQDGKSTTTSNLAVTLAQAGNHVLLVDCDLRKPMQHKIFGFSNHQGLTNYLLQNLDLDDIVHREVLPNLDVATSGPIPPNPAEILNSDRTRCLWKELLNTYDYVIVDAPPVLAVADASILASQVEGVVMVVRSSHTRIDLARKAKEQLVTANGRLVGVVLNDLNMESKDYQYYYYYSSENSNEKKKNGIIGMLQD